MTQEYIVGQFSTLLGELQTSLGEYSAVVSQVRREVESSPVGHLPDLVSKALGLTEAMCWAALGRGDAAGFDCCATAAGALWDFADSAGLLPSGADV